MRNSSLAKCSRAENTSGLKHVTAITAVPFVNLVHETVHKKCKTVDGRRFPPAGPVHKVMHALWIKFTDGMGEGSVPNATKAYRKECWSVLK